LHPQGYARPISERARHDAYSDGKQPAIPTQASR
jgi:hypothetical protein